LKRIDKETTAANIHTPVIQAKELPIDKQT